MHINYMFSLLSNYIINNKQVKNRSILQKMRFVRYVLPLLPCTWKNYAQLCKGVNLHTVDRTSISVQAPARLANEIT